MKIILISQFSWGSLNVVVFISFKQIYTLNVILVILYQAPAPLIKCKTEGNEHHWYSWKLNIEYRQLHQHIYLKAKKMNIIVKISHSLTWPETSRKKTLTAKNTLIRAFHRIFYEICYDLQQNLEKILRKRTIFHIFEHSSIPPKITKQNKNNWERKERWHSYNPVRF